MLQVSIAVFFRALSKIFGGKDGSASTEKIGPYAYAYWSSVSIQILKFTGNKLQNKDT